MPNSEVWGKTNCVLLDPIATEVQYRELCKKAEFYGVAAICVPPVWVKFCCETLQAPIPVGTVIGYPFGLDTTGVKIFAVKQAIDDGAQEIEVVMNGGWMVSMCSGDDQSENRRQTDVWLKNVRQEVERVRRACGEGVTLKISTEMELPSYEQKVELCQIATDVKVDYLKTAAGCGTAYELRGLHDALASVHLLRKHVGSKVKIELAGGILRFDDMTPAILAGCDRVCASLGITEEFELRFC